MTSKAKEKRDPKTGRFRKGNVAAVKHGAYAIARAKGSIPSVRGVRALARYLDHAKGELEKLVTDLNIKEELYISHVIRTEEKMRLIDMWVRKVGILRPDKARRGVLELHPALSQSYLSYMNSQRLALQALNIPKEKAAKALNPKKYLDIFDGKKE